MLFSRRYLLLIFSSVVYLTCFNFVHAQKASFQGLGDLPGGLTSSRAYGVSPDGFAVVGESCTGTSSYDVEPFLWLDSLRINSHTVLPQRIINLGILSWCTNGRATDVSDSGKAVCGYCFDHGDLYYPFYWTDSSGIMDMDTSGNDTRAYGGSADGKIAVGTWHNYFNIPDSAWTPEACMWIYPSTSMGLGYLDAFFHISAARAISSDGSTVVGSSRISDISHVLEVLFEAFYWTDSTGMVGIGTEYLYGYPVSTAAAGVSPKGDWIVGVASLADYSAAFAWSDSTKNIYLEPLPPSTVSRANAVSDKGLIIVGDEGRHAWGDGVDALIWMKTDNWYQKYYVKDYLEINCGLDLTGWDLRETTDISDDGRVIVGYGRNPSGVIEAWRAVLPRIEIIKPQYNELFKPLAKSYYDPVDRFPHPPDTIKWLTYGVEQVNIVFSADSGKTYSDTLVKNHPCPEDTGKFIWWVPDTLSRECMIKISDADQPEPINAAESDVFRIKGYELTRVKDDSTYEAFKSNKNGWNFKNNNPPLWTPNFYVDYLTETDPATNIPYNMYYAGIFSHYSPPSIFPSWPIFVGAFGEEQSYVWAQHLAAAPSPSAFEYWWSNRREWKGSCFGMSVAASLAFSRPDELSASYPDLGNIKYIHGLPSNDNNINMINDLHTRQFDFYEYLHYTPDRWSDGPVKVIDDLKKVLLDSTELYNHRILSYFNLVDEYGALRSGAHSVLPYKIEIDGSDPDIVYIYTYDPNSPNIKTKFAVYRSINNWNYFFPPHAFGMDGLILEQPSEVFLQYAQIPPQNIIAKNNEQNITNRIQEESLNIYNPTAGEICIRNSQQDSIGFADSMYFNTMAGASPLIPRTGNFHKPTGYKLPADSYDMVLNSMTDSIAYASVFHDNIIYSYQRGDALATQTDYLQYTNGISVGTYDPENKIVNLRSILKDNGSEKMYNIGDLQLAQDDYFNIKMETDTNLSMENEGSEKLYNLTILNYAPNVINTYEGRKIIIESNSTHQFQPLWDSLSVAPLKILIDNDNDGTVDDSMFVENEFTGINYDKHSQLPEKFYVSQNYPNPFNQTTVIRYELPIASNIDLSIYNILGQKVATLVSEKQKAGTYNVEWDASGFASGVYLYQLQTENYTETRKMIFMK